MITINLSDSMSKVLTLQGKYEHSTFQYSSVISCLHEYMQSVRLLE